MPGSQAIPSRRAETGTSSAPASLTKVSSLGRRLPLSIRLTWVRWIDARRANSSWLNRRDCRTDRRFPPNLSEMSIRQILLQRPGTDHSQKQTKSCRRPKLVSQGKRKGAVTSHGRDPGDPLDEGRDRDFERSRQLDQRVQSGHPFTALDEADLSPVDRGLERELFLGHPRRLTQPDQVPCKAFGDIHAETLCLADKAALQRLNYCFWSPQITCQCRVKLSHMASITHRGGWLSPQFALGFNQIERAISIGLSQLTQPFTRRSRQPAALLRLGSGHVPDPMAVAP
jgi:hypothetical protein